MARNDTTLTDTVDGVVQFLSDAAETAFALSWVVLWGYWSWLVGWAIIGVPLALVAFTLGLMKTIQHASRGEQFHPAVWVLIVSLDAVAAVAISRTSQSPFAQQVDRTRSEVGTEGTALRMLTDAVQRDDVAAMTAAIRNLGKAEATAAAEAIARILRNNSDSSSPDRRDLALASIEALSNTQSASACSLLREVASKQLALAEAAQRAVRQVCVPKSSPGKSLARRGGSVATPSRAGELGHATTTTASGDPGSSSTSTGSATSTGISAEPQRLESAISPPKSSDECGEAAERFWRRHGFDKPGANGVNGGLTYSYRHHYNTELRQCLVAVRLQTTWPDGSVAVSTEISDALEDRDRPMAALMTRASGLSASPQVAALLKNGERLQPIPENLAWFQALMTK